MRAGTLIKGAELASSLLENRAQAASKQSNASMRKTQSEEARLNTENATLREELEAKTQEIKVLKAMLEEQKKAA